MSSFSLQADNDVLVSSLEKSLGNVEQLIEHITVSAETPSRLPPNLEPYVRDLIFICSKSCQKLAQITTTGLKNDLATACPADAHIRLSIVLPQALHAVSEATRLFGAQNNELILLEQGKKESTDVIGDGKEFNQDISTFADFHKERSEHLGEIRGLKDKIAHHQNPNSMSYTLNHARGNVSGNAIGHGLTSGGPEGWKRKMKQPGFGSDSEANLPVWNATSGVELKEPRNIYSTFVPHQQDGGPTDLAEEKEQLGILRAELYRKQIQFIFRVVKLYFRARGGRLKNPVSYPRLH